MNLITGIILVLLLIGIILALVTTIIYITQERYFFYPTKLSPNYPFQQFPEHEELFFNTPNDGNINALMFKTVKPKGVIFYTHGNARALDDWGWVHKDFKTKGYDVLVYDFRTYGKSTGKLTERNMYEDARHILHFLLERYQKEQIVIYGRSLGASIATQLATEFDCKCLVLETPFSSMLSIVHASTPFLPVKLILRYKFNNRRKMRRLKCPVHIFHGTKDELIPLRHAKRLKQANSNPLSTLTIIEDGNHNNLTEYALYHSTMDKILNA